MAVVTDRTFNLNGVVRTTVILFLVSNEAISVLENLSRIGVKIPHKLADILKQISKEKD